MATLTKLTEASEPQGGSAQAWQHHHLPPRNEASLSNLVLDNLKLILRTHCLVSPGSHFWKSPKDRPMGQKSAIFSAIPASLQALLACCPFLMLPASSSTLKSFPESPLHSKVASHLKTLCVCGEQGLTQSWLLCSKQGYNPWGEHTVMDWNYLGVHRLHLTPSHHLGQTLEAEWAECRPTAFSPTLWSASSITLVPAQSLPDIPPAAWKTLYKRVFLGAVSSYQPEHQVAFSYH